MEAMNIKAADINLENVLAFINTILENNDCPRKIQMQIDIAVEEIYVNVAHYAYFPEEGDVLIKCGVCDGEAVVSFEDNGTPYDPLKKPDPDVSLPADERQIGGLGIYMVKQSMDSVHYDYKHGRNVFTLKKKLI